MNRRELAGQHALMESSVARPQHRSAVGGELRGHAQARRPDVPRVERAEALHGGAGLVARDDRAPARSGLIARVWSNLMPALIVSRSPIVIASLANAPAVMNSPPGVAGSREIGLKRLPAAVDVSHAGRDDAERVVLPLLGLAADLPFVVGAEKPGR